MQTTNQPLALNFIGFLSEALPYVDAWTPTKVNYGGCGVFAALLSDQLTTLGIKHKIIAIVFEQQGEGYENLRRFVSNGEGLTKAGEDHIVICINDEVYVDSTGVVNYTVLHAKERIELSREQLQQLIDHGKWNPTFDRTCIPVMKEKMQEAFSKYTMFHSGIFPYPGENDVKYTEHTARYLMRSNPFARFFNSL